MKEPTGKGKLAKAASGEPSDVPVASALSKHPRFPLGLVSNIAARLLKGDCYEDAARRTLCLLDACANELKRDAEDHYEREELLAQIQEQEQHLSPLTTFEAVAIRVTGQGRPERAAGLFRKFLNHLIKHDKAIHSLGHALDFAEDPDALYFVRYAATPETSEKEVAKLCQDLKKGVRELTAQIWKRLFKDWHADKKSAVAQSKGKLGGRGKRSNESPT